MRLAVVSDIHGNLTALEAVVESLKLDQPDLVVQAGDLAVTGARPGEVVDLIRSLGWRSLLGNTDEMLWDSSARSQQEERAPKLRAWLNVLFDTLAPWARDRLSDAQLDWLRSLPSVLRLSETAVMHAGPGDLWRAPMPDALDAELSATYAPIGAGLIIYGHIHRPFVRAVAGFTLVNCGSVGLPYDGDWRPSYALIDDSQLVTIRRVEYDLESEKRAIRQSGFPLGEWLIEVERQGLFTRPPLTTE
jgi:predicted phosphodiesterase